MLLLMYVFSSILHWLTGYSILSSVNSKFTSIILNISKTREYFFVNIKNIDIAIWFNQVN